MSKAYRLISGSAAEKFHLSRQKIRLYGGGFANGKTTALVAAGLNIAKDYPGANILFARETYPKLNSTLRREFVKWCPPSWIKSFDKSKENTCVLVNGTTIDFRYIAISGNAESEGTSNLLSANYDAILVDQIDDPGITYEDFQHLLGRLRGSTPYGGDDPTMPATGPRWLLLSCNPTLSWPYKNLVKPLHDFRVGLNNDDLLCVRDEHGNPVLDESGKKQPIIDVFEASTYDNAQNIEADYIKTMEATYRGKMRDRYLLGKWVAFEGTVYDEYDPQVHMVPDRWMREYIAQLRMEGHTLTVTEGYDLGLAVPSCYLLSMNDPENRLLIVDGFYEPMNNVDLDGQVELIEGIREDWRCEDVDDVYADPQIFKRTSVTNKGVGKSTAELFRERGIYMRRGNNAIINGIVKVKLRLQPQPTLINPFTGAYGSPKLIISDKLQWLGDEFTTYRWRKNRADQSEDVPIDRDDHGMDTIKYICSNDILPARLTAKRYSTAMPKSLARWHETEAPQRDQRRQHRYS